MNRKLWENMASLFSVQALNYILPLFTLPFLARVLGPENWGALAFAEGFSVYISLVVEYGFGLSASRDISQLRESPSRCSEYLANVVGAQFLLALVSVGMTSLALLGPGRLAAYRSLLPLATLLSFSRSVFPSCFFQGLEKMKLIAILSIASNTACALSLFMFVKSNHDAWVVLALRASGSILSAAFAFRIAYRAFPFVPPSFQGILRVLKSGGPLFLFKGLVSLYTTANVIMLGIMGTPLDVAWFAGAEKICKAALNTLGPISQTFYPRINYLLKNDPHAALRTIRASVLITVGTGTAAGLFMFFGAPWLVKLLLGQGFEAAVPILRVISLLPPIISITNVFGIQWMLSLRMEKLFSWILLLAGLVNLGCALLLVPAYGAMGMAVSMVIAETVVMSGVVLALVLNKKNPLVDVQEAPIAA